MKTVILIMPFLSVPLSAIIYRLLQRIERTSYRGATFFDRFMVVMLNLQWVSCTYAAILGVMNLGVTLARGARMDEGLTPYPHTAYWVPPLLALLFYLYVRSQVAATTSIVEPTRRSAGIG